MDINQLKTAILICRDAKITSLTWGHRGLGKSQAHQQIAVERRWGFLDMRCSQMEASDMRGLPDKKDGRTIYLPPDDMPKGHDPEAQCPACDESFDPTGYPQNEYCKGIFFLDELNRAEDDVLQAGFQLVLDRRVGQYKVPDGWSIHVAGNFGEGYMVNNFQDPAFLNRFCHLDVGISEQYLEGWADYMKRFKSADRILQFVGFNKDHLQGKIVGERGFSVTPSPRSWEMVARVEEACIGKDDEYPIEIKREVIAGLIGRELALQFERFSCEVTPKDVMERPLSEYENRLRKLTRNQAVGLIMGVGSNAKDKKTQKVIDNVLDFMGWIASNAIGEKNAVERDLAVSLGRQLCSTESASLGGAVLSNPNLAKLAARFKSKTSNGADGGPSWILSINRKPDLQALMSKVAYGDDKK